MNPMTEFLLDSDGLISYEHRRPVMLDLLDDLRLSGHTLGSCPITIAEFYSGRLRGSDVAVDDFVDALHYWPIEYDDAIQAGRWRYEFAYRGIQLSATDTLIAAVARRVGATILTGNLKDFPMEDVSVQSLLG
jgi:predicted nucleic acid-binding protein